MWELGAPETIYYTREDLVELVRAAHPGGIEVPINNHGKSSSCGSCSRASMRVPFIEAAYSDAAQFHLVARASNTKNSPCCSTRERPDSRQACAATVQQPG